MVVVRNKLAEISAGGPRQYAELRDRLLLRLDETGRTEDTVNRLRGLGLDVQELRNAPVAVAEPSGNVEETIQQFSDEIGEDLDDEVQNAINTIRDGGDIIEADIAVRRITLEILDSVRQIEGVITSSFAKTYADYGPENLGKSPFEMPTVMQEEQKEGQTLGELYATLGVYGAHEEERGQRAIVAIFDTGYAPDLIQESRLVNTWSGDDVDSVYASSEGHGTMCAGAAAANSEGPQGEDGSTPPFDGVAPDAGVILVRTTDSNGQIRGDYIAQAWDWLSDLDTNRPIVANHSYGTPLCSGRPRSEFCDTPLNDEISIILSDDYITGVYAAGNEAMRCGHRPSGVTNAITGTNSLDDIVTVGALLTSGSEAQKYSSHGRGDCAPISDPKPNVSSAIPVKTYYGAEGGYVIKDMSTGVIGSSGGTSHASPTIAGMLALIQSKAMKVRGEPFGTEELKQIIRGNSEPPRTTQVNAFGGILARDGWDARFGYGQLNINSALDSIGEQ
jgi:hypothetical protein